MINRTDIEVSFLPSTIPGAKTYGIATINVGGICILTTIFKSALGAGFFISYPNKPILAKDGTQERDEKGKPKYRNEVYIKDAELRGILEDAVLNAMANKGVYPKVTTQESQTFNVEKVEQTHSTSGANQSFKEDSEKKIFNDGASLIQTSDLPF